MERILGADAGAGMKSAELRPEISSIAGQMWWKVIAECVMTAFHTLRSADIQGMGYILRIGIRMCL